MDKSKESILGIVNLKTFWVLSPAFVCAFFITHYAYVRVLTIKAVFFTSKNLGNPVFGDMSADSGDEDPTLTVEYPSFSTSLLPDDSVTCSKRIIGTLPRLTSVCQCKQVSINTT